MVQKRSGQTCVCVSAACQCVPCVGVWLKARTCVPRPHAVSSLGAEPWSGRTPIAYLHGRTGGRRWAPPCWLRSRGQESTSQLRPLELPRYPSPQALVQPRGSARAREADCGNPGSLVALGAPPAAPPAASTLPAREAGSGHCSCSAWRPSGMEENWQVSVASSIYSINVLVHGNNEVGREIEHSLVCDVALCIVFHSVTNYFPAVSWKVAFGSNWSAALCCVRTQITQQRLQKRLARTPVCPSGQLQGFPLSPITLPAWQY